MLVDGIMQNKQFLEREEALSKWFIWSTLKEGKCVLLLCRSLEGNRFSGRIPDVIGLMQALVIL
jgi:hypothetical protein